MPEKELLGRGPWLNCVWSATVISVCRVTPYTFSYHGNTLPLSNAYKKEPKTQRLTSVYISRHSEGFYKAWDMIGTWKLFLLLIFCLILVVHFAECSKRSSRRRNSVAKQSRRRQSAARQSRRRSSYVKQSRRRSSSVKQSRRRSSSAKQSRRRSSSIKHSRRRHRPGKPIKGKYELGNLAF